MTLGEPLVERLCNGRVAKAVYAERERFLSVIQALVEGLPDSHPARTELARAAHFIRSGAS